MMSCTGTIIRESHEEPILRSGSSLRPNKGELRRRYSSYHSEPWLQHEVENIQLLVDQFLTQLSKRLDFLESYGHLNLDAGIERAYNTLHAVRDSCADISDGMIDAGRRRASVLVETLEERYKDALATKEGMEAKVQEGVRMMESILAEFESRAYAVRDSGIGTIASDFLDEGLRRMDGAKELAKEVVDEGLEKARRAKEHMKESIEHTIERALVRARQHKLITYDDLPVPWRVNPYITKGYRFHDAKVDCLRSVLSLSNETVNIWSHLIGLIFVLSIAFYFYPSSHHFSLSTNSDVFIAAVFFFAAAKCLVCSCCWHTFNSIAEQTLMERFACVDYTGISLLVASSIMTTEYTAFYCEPVSRWIYMLTTASLGVGGVILPWHPTFNRADMAWARVGFYVCLTLTGFLPVLQLSWSRGLQWAIYFYAPVTKSLLVYLTGAILYASKVPERWFPGVFDYVGGSHNIWHLAVLGGIYFHYCAMKVFFKSAFLRAETHCSVY